MGFQSSLFPDNLPNQESRLDRTNHGFEYFFEQNPSMNNTTTATGQVWLTVDIPAKYLLFRFAFVSVKGLCFGIHQACPVWESRYFEVNVLNQETSDLVVSSLSLSMFPFWDGYHPQILPRCMGNGICALCQAGSAASPGFHSRQPWPRVLKTSTVKSITNLLPWLCIHNVLLDVMNVVVTSPLFIGDCFVIFNACIG